MKKIAWLLAFLLVFQSMPMSVKAETTTTDTEVIGSSVYYETKLKDGTSTYPILFMKEVSSSTYSCSLNSVTVDGENIKDFANTFKAERIYQYDSARGTVYYVLLKGNLDASVYPEGNHSVTANITTSTYSGTENVELSHTFSVKKMETSYIITEEEPMYVSSVNTYSFEPEGKTFYVSSTDVAAKKIELLDKTGTVISTIDRFSSYAYPDKDDIRYTNSLISCNIADQSSYLYVEMAPRSKFSLNSPLANGHYDVRYTLSDGTTYTVEDAILATDSPVVYSITDTTSTHYTLPMQLSTDQTGNYVSVYVYGLNISKNTVKPVFYDSSSNEISGDVVAEEKTASGAYLRIKKETSPEWTIENTDSKNEKTFDVGFVSLSDNEVIKDENVAKSVSIARRDIFYRYYDSVRKTFTVYFASDSNVDTSVKPKLTFQYYEQANKPTVVKTFIADKIISETNKFTGQVETKAVFDIADLNEEEFGYWTPEFAVSFTKKDGEIEEYSLYDDDNVSQICGNVSTFGQTSEIDKVKGNRDVVLYYPYWIGSVYQFADTGTGAYHYITADEAAYLGDERFTYSAYAKGSGNSGYVNSSDRFYSLTFFVEGEESIDDSGSSGVNTGTGTDLSKESIIKTMEEYGLDSNDIIYAESNEVALAIAEEYAMMLAEINPSLASLTAEDLVKALRGSDSTGGNSTKPDTNTSTKPGDNTSADGNTATQQPSDHKHSYTYKSNNDATVLIDGTKTGTCTCGNVITVPNTGSKLAASIKVPAKSFAMKVKQIYKGFQVTMGKGDSIKSIKPSSSSKKLIKVSKIDKSKGTFTLTAQKKTGKAKVTITLASGKKQTLTITVQKKDVKTTKISGLKSKVTLKKGKSTTLKPVITPITSKQKVKFKTSNKKVATVSSKGVVKAKKKGTTKITVTSGSKNKTVKVTVK